ncbi:MAG TPA: protein-L-isoaspartate(D-aspartate) O-methyltransferase [Bacteroidetes bacterium]|nr:protein-L-isoaspartate(D-aspartate) O-methyltransferase [Bacteroidota bacterium]
MKRFFGLWTTALLLLISCKPNQESRFMEKPSVQDEYAELRNRMVVEQIASRGVSDPRVLAAMRKVPRHEFVPEEYRDLAYRDTPLPIGYGQTISQPYIVAYMTEQLHIGKEDTVLEIGTGSGYQAAVLAELASEVYTIEIIPELAERAKKTLRRLGYNNVHVRIGDGYKGWPEHAPFDAIILAAAPPRVPQPLLDQLKEGGRLIAPVGEDYQELVLIRKENGEILRENLIPVRFVPMTGEAQKHF